MNIKRSTILVAGAAVLFLIAASVVLFLGQGGESSELLTLDTLKSDSEDVADGSGASGLISTHAYGLDEGDMTHQYSMYMRQESGEQIYKIAYAEEGKVLVDPVSDKDAEAGMEEIGQEELWVVDDEKWESEGFNIGALIGELTEEMIIRAEPSGTLYYIQASKGHIQIIENTATLDEWEGEGWEDVVYSIKDEEAGVFDAYLEEWEQVYAEQEEEEESAEESQEVVVVVDEPEDDEAAVNRTVAGTVTNSVTGLPVPGVSIVVSNSSRNTTADINGEFELELSSGARGYEIYVATNKWYESSGTKAVSGGEDVSFTLTPADSGAYDLVFPKVTYTASSNGGTQISGYVRNANSGESITGVSLAASNTSVFLQTDEDGYVYDDSVPAMPYRFYITGGDPQYPNTYYQVETVKGYMAIVEFEIDVQE